MAVSTSRLEFLASAILENTKLVDKYIKANDLPSLSFESSQPSHLFFPLEIEAARRKIIDSTQELHQLCSGAKEILYSHHALKLIPLHFISAFNIANLVPVSGSATFSEIASQCEPPQQEGNVRTLLRHAMTDRIFQEEEIGRVRHTAASRLLAENETVRDKVSFDLEYMWAVALQTVPALKKWPSSQEPNHTAFCLANNTTAPMYEEIGKQPHLAAKFASAMTAENDRYGLSPRHLSTLFPWSSLPSGTTIVDVGGSTGNICIILDCEFRENDFRFIVQDRAEVIAAIAPIDVKSGLRLRFMAHDFFTEQPVKDADIYLLRFILHNWSDSYCIDILRRLVPALKDGARVLVNDIVLPDLGGMGSNVREARMRQVDIFMLMAFNSHERELQNWKDLFSKADPGFQYCETRCTAESILSLIEFTWDSGKAQARAS